MCQKCIDILPYLYYIIFMKKISLIFLRFLTGYILLYLSGVFINLFGMVIYALSVLLTAVPIILNNTARFSLKKEIKLIEYEKSKKFYNLLSGKTFGYILIIIVSLFFAFIIPVRVYLFSSIEFLCLLIIFPLLLISRFISTKIILAIYNNRYAPYKIESLTYILTAFLSAVIFPLLAYSLKDINIHIPFLDNDINSLQYNYAAYMIGNILNLFDNISNTILDAEVVKSAPLWFFTMLLIILGGGGFIFYGIVSFISFFFIKKENLMKVFMSAKHDENTKINKFLTSFIIILLAVFIYPSVFAAVTYIAAAKQEVVEDTIKANTVAVEVINGVMYKAGTLNKIQLAADMVYGAAKEDLIKNVNKMYDDMLLNTDKYLDWYYSLSAEYGRLLKLITGSIEEYMADKLKENLMDNISSNIDFGSAEKNIDNLQKNIDKILSENKITEKDALYSINININVDDIYSLADIKPLLDFKERMIASTGGGLAAGAIVGTIAGKVAAKTGFKTAAKAAAKAAAGKAASAAAGVAAGVVSSIFTSPIGGAAIGTATGVAIDKGLLKLEEAVNRDEYKNEITQSIEENRKQMIDMINKAFEEK